MTHDQLRLDFGRNVLAIRYSVYTSRSSASDSKISISYLDYSQALTSSLSEADHVVQAPCCSLQEHCVLASTALYNIGARTRRYSFRQTFLFLGGFSYDLKAAINSDTKQVGRKVWSSRGLFQ